MGTTLAGYIIIFALGFFALFASWKKSTRRGIPLFDCFDSFIIASVSALFLGRVGQILMNISDYIESSWSIFPYYVTGAKKVWFDTLPWRIIRLNEGLDYQLAFFIFILIAAFYTGRKAKNYLASLDIYSTAIITFETVLIIAALVSQIFDKFTDLIIIGPFNKGLDALSFIALILLLLLGGLNIWLEANLKEMKAGTIALINTFIFGVYQLLKTFMDYEHETIFGVKSALIFSLYLFLVAIFIYFQIKGQVDESSISRLERLDLVKKQGILSKIKTKLSKNSKSNTSEPSSSRRRVTSNFNISYKKEAKNTNLLYKLWNNLITYYYKVIRRKVYATD